jgi:hypothetical protein
MISMLHGMLIAGQSTFFFIFDFFFFVIFLKKYITSFICVILIVISLLPVMPIFPCFGKIYFVKENKKQ